MPAQPRAEAKPRVPPRSTLLLSVAVFSTTTCSGIFLPTPGFSHEVSSCPVFPEPLPLSAHPSPCPTGQIPTSRANSCLPVCLGFTQGLFLLSLGPQWPVAGWTLSPTSSSHAGWGRALLGGGAGHSPHGKIAGMDAEPMGQQQRLDEAGQSPSCSSDLWLPRRQTTQGQQTVDPQLLPRQAGQAPTPLREKLGTTLPWAACTREGWASLGQLWEKAA